MHDIVCETGHLIPCCLKDGPRTGSMGIPGELLEM